MSIGISKLFEDAEALADQRRLTSSIEIFEEARRLTRHPERRAWASFNLGTIHWHLLGNGVAARREFLASIADFEAHGYGHLPVLKTMHANALENMMFCALSFDEFEDLAARLHALTPGVPVLTGLVPVLQERRKRGDPWSGALFALADTYYDRTNPKQDVGRYGEAKSTYHLILTHRRELRASRVDWRIALFEYCALSGRMATDCVITRGDDQDVNSPEEYLHILTEAIPFADEYLALHTGDDEIRKIRTQMQQTVDGCREYGATHNSKEKGARDKSYDGMSRVTQGCLLLPAFLLILVWLAFHNLK
jgi:hypothetical protein